MELLLIEINHKRTEMHENFIVVEMLKIMSSAKFHLEPVCLLRRFHYILKLTEFIPKTYPY